MEFDLGVGRGFWGWSDDSLSHCVAQVEKLWTALGSVRCLGRWQGMSLSKRQLCFHLHLEQICLEVLAWAQVMNSTCCAGVGIFSGSPHQQPVGKQVQAAPAPALLVDGASHRAGRWPTMAPRRCHGAPPQSHGGCCWCFKISLHLGGRSGFF